MKTIIQIIILSCLIIPVGKDNDHTLKSKDFFKYCGKNLEVFLDDYPNLSEPLRVSYTKNDVALDNCIQYYTIEYQSFTLMITPFGFHCKKSHEGYTLEELKQIPIGKVSVSYDEISPSHLNYSWNEFSDTLNKIEFPSTFGKLVEETIVGEFSAYREIYTKEECISSLILHYNLPPEYSRVLVKFEEVNCKEKLSMCNYENLKNVHVKKLMLIESK